MSEKSFISNGVQGLQAFAFSVVTVHDQCITVRQRTARYHSSALLTCTFFAYFTLIIYFMLYLLSFCFMLQLPHVLLFLCCAFSELHFFILHSFQVAPFTCYALLMLHLFLCCTLFMLHLFCVAHISCSTFSVLHFFRIALCSSCTFFVLYTFRVALFCVALFFSHFLLFSCCTFFRVVLFSRFTVLLFYCL